LGYTPSNNLGYGIGKIVRGAFDYLTYSWQKMWAQEPSAEELMISSCSSLIDLFILFFLGLPKPFFY
jgi:hypothetical protein